MNMWVSLKNTLNLKIYDKYFACHTNHKKIIFNLTLAECLRLRRAQCPAPAAQPGQATPLSKATAHTTLNKHQEVMSIYSSLRGA